MLEVCDTAMALRSHLGLVGFRGRRLTIMKEKTKNTVVVATWWLGVVIATIALMAPVYRQGDVCLARTSPFDNTGSGHAEQWRFLSEAAEHIPSGASFTVAAQDRETEMSLFMMAVGLLPHATPLPTSYYGRSTSPGTTAPYVLEYRNAPSGRTPHDNATEVSGGWVRQRLENEP